MVRFLVFWRKTAEFRQFSQIGTPLANTCASGGNGSSESNQPGVSRNVRTDRHHQPLVRRCYLARHLGGLHGHRDHPRKPGRPDRLIAAPGNSKEGKTMFNSEAGNRVLAALSALALSIVVFATAIIPAIPGLGVLA